MRKRIAAFVGEIGREFQVEFVKSLKKVANSRDYDVFVFSNFGAYTSTHIFDIGERDIINVPVFSEFDGVISLSDTFDIDGMESLLIKRIKETSNCPIISVRNGSKNTYRIMLDDYKTTYNMTKHFIEDHGFKNICYFSGPHAAADAVERLNGFKAAMSDAGLPVTSDCLFEGDYWVFRCLQALNHFMAANDGKLPEAIICANDYMAIGICEEIKKLGFSIPEDVAIAGFDEIVEGMGYSPTLTTIKMPTDKLANAAVDILGRILNGEDVDMDTYLSGSIRKKGSCGCNLCEGGIDVSNLSHKLIENYVDVRMSGLITTDVENCITEVEKLSLLGSYYERVGCARGFLCLCTDDKKNDNPYSETMQLRKIFIPDPPEKRDIYNPSRRDNGEFFEDGGITFDRKLILPEEYYDSSTPSCFVILPIHHRDESFGYLVNELDDNSKVSIFISTFVTALAIAYDDLGLQAKYSEFVEIKRQNLIDSLTGLYNRRGFDQALNMLVREKELKESSMGFISADMDNLKYINDNYGHHEGDFALKLVGEVLKKCTGEKDIVAHTGGDEFWVILTSTNIALNEGFEKIVESTLASECKKYNKEYPIHVSIGTCIPKKDDLTDPTECFKLADRRMYANKKAYKKTLSL